MPLLYRIRAPLVYLAAILLMLPSGGAEAALCSWNVASGNWNALANWAGCADTPGPSTRTPGVNDIALIGSGAVSFNVNATVAEFEIGSGASLTLVGGAPLTLTVNNALRLNGGTLSTTDSASFPYLRVVLALAGSGQVLASSTLSNTVELENRGTLQLLSASGTALNVQNLSRLINVGGSSFLLGGGNARVHLDGQVPLTVQAGATMTTSGDVFIGKTLATSGAPRIESYGTLAHSGPGILTIQGSGSGGSNAAVLQTEGLLSISGGTLRCNTALDNCRQQNGSNGFAVLDLVLNNGTYERGGASALALSVPLGSRLRGSGTIDGGVSILGTLAPGAASGVPYGALTINGALSFSQQSILDIDLGGSAAGAYDRVQVGAALSVGGSGVTNGYGVMNLRLAPGYTPAMGESVAPINYASVAVDSTFYRIDANYALDFATRFDPTELRVFPAPRIYVDELSVVEGNSGSTAANLNIRLSQASTQTVTALVGVSNGTAVSGPAPGGDFLFTGGTAVSFAPGQTLQTKPITVNGDLLVEGDEAFVLRVLRNKVVNAAIGNQVPGSPVASATLLTDDLAPGTRFVLVGKTTSGNQIRRYTSDGVFIDAWGPSQPNLMNYVATGLCFSPQGQVLTTRFAHSNPILHSHAGAVLNAEFGRPPGSNPFSLHESCVYDRAGNVYIGQAGIGGASDAQVAVKKLDGFGNALDSYTVPTGDRGTDWIELAGDQCTLYYTSEDTSVRRYNLCTRTVLPLFASGLTAPYCYALRLRPNRELMVACRDAVHRISPQGVNLHTYTRQSIGETDAGGLFAINLDPDGSSFWTAGGQSGNVYRVDIASGAVLSSFNSGVGGVSGLAIYDELGDDTIFIDGFDLLATAPILPTGSGSALFEIDDCAGETEFWPRVADMPHYVPDWITVVARDAEGDCSEH